MTTRPEGIAGRRDGHPQRFPVSHGRCNTGRSLRVSRHVWAIRSLWTRVGATGVVRRVGRDLVVAIAATGGAFAVLELVLPPGTSSATYATGSAAIAIAAISSGVVAGFLALGLASAAALFLHLPPVGAFAVSNSGELLGLVLFGLNGLTLAILGAWLRSRRVHGRCGHVSPSAFETALVPVRPTSESADDAVALRTVPFAATFETLVEPLTSREIEVLGLLAGGLSNEDIAAALFVSLNTVKTHLKNIFGKLGVTSRLQATVRAAQLGLLDPDAFASPSWVA